MNLLRRSLASLIMKDLPRCASMGPLCVLKRLCSKAPNFTARQSLENVVDTPRIFSYFTSSSLPRCFSVVQQQTNRSVTDPRRIDPVNCPMVGTSEILVPGTDRSETSVIDDTPRIRRPPKLAHRMLIIRRKKMNKHKLKKLRKKMKFVYRRIKHKRWKTKEKLFQQELDAIRQEGVEFDALEFVKARIRHAKRGGFRVEVVKGLI